MLGSSFSFTRRAQPTSNYQDGRTYLFVTFADELISGPASAILEPAAEGAGAGKPCEAVGEAVEADMLGGMMHFGQNPGRMFRLIWRNSTVGACRFG
ncbi:BQ5605_C035g11448 [Microbotryum silenes-dioicae]|uniref:BQ5605_C035g11448 protein n=1 Tax=Microbotryum silenes-dioicae TaxID=796604 RepID=A0A2X0N2H5_9BASI|nr:BQ5605_C035g11448 [Microbotryum silenes-dioicae]